jgi:hypothetical protein
MYRMRNQVNLNTTIFHVIYEFGLIMHYIFGPPGKIGPKLLTLLVLQRFFSPVRSFLNVKLIRYEALKVTVILLRIDSRWPENHP